MGSGQPGGRLELRSYMPGDELAIAELFSAAFGHPFPEAAWQWRFRGAPAGQGVVEMVWDGDVLCAHCGVTPVTMLCHGQEMLGGLGGTAMTHPAYRGQGLYAQLYNRCIERMDEMGMPLFFAFPDANRVAHRLLVHDLGLVDIHEVPRFSLQVRDRRPQTEDRRDDHVEELASFDARFDELWARAQARYAVIVKRDSRYLNWRFTLKPGAQYRTFGYVDGAELLGYAVLKNYDRDLQIVDVLTVSGVGVGVALVANAVRLAQSEGLESVSMWLNPADRLHVELERLGFQPCPPIVYFGARFIGDGSPDSPFYHFRNWHLMMSDSDVY